VTVKKITLFERSELGIYKERTTEAKAVGSLRPRSRFESFFGFVFLWRISANSAMQGGTKYRIAKKEREAQDI